MYLQCNRHLQKNPLLYKTLKNSETWVSFTSCFFFFLKRAIHIFFHKDTRGKYVREIVTQRERHNFLILTLLACNENSNLKVIKKKKSYSSRLQAYLTRKYYVLFLEKK